ncbi:MAG: hypothetical protein ACNA71_01915 [Kiritimatiellia bacterium]
MRAGMNYDLGQLSNIDLGIHSQVRVYDDSLIAQLSDKNELGGGIAFRHTLSQNLRGLANVYYTTYSFKEDEIGSRDFTSITTTLGLEYVFIPDVIGSVSGGMQTRSYDEARFETDDNAHVRVELSGPLTSDLRVGILGGTGVRDSDVHPYPSQEYIEVRAYADMAISYAISLRGAATYRNSSYDPYPGLALLGGDETVIVLDAQLTYRATETASFIIGHRFEDVDADESLRRSFTGNFTRNTTRAGMTLDF